MPIPLRVAGAILLVLFLVACGSPDQSGAAGPAIQVSTELAAEQVINRQIDGDPRTLDPSLSTGVPAEHVLDDLFEGLVTVAEDGSNVPGVAKSWETSADGKTWTFHLRDDARWSNGQPVTANDFVYAWRREVDPATASEYAEALAPLQNAVEIAEGKMPVDRLGVEAPDAHTVIAHLKAPTAYFLDLLTDAYLCPLYEPAIMQWGDAWTQPGHMVSNGAYMLTERVINGHITLLKNPYYWDAKNVHLTKVVFHPVSDRNATTDQFLAGNLDFTNEFTHSDMDRLRRSLGPQLVTAPYFGTVMFGFNLAKPPFQNNPKLRIALSMAIDRDILVKYVQRGIGVATYHMIPPLKGYDPAIPDWAKLTDEDRHALARKLYHEAGYSDSHPLETVLSYPSGGAEVRRFMEALSAMWQTTLGAKVQIYNVEWKVLLQSLQLKQPVLYWDAWIGDYPDPFTFMQLFQTGFPQNYGDYHNPQFDSLLEEATNTADLQRHFQLLHQAEEILNRDAPYMALYTYESTHLVKPYVKGWKSNITDRNLSRYMYVLEHQERTS
jgi:oligopeptide transport system substrate-binding protein